MAVIGGSKVFGNQLGGRAGGLGERKSVIVHFDSSAQRLPKKKLFGGTTYLPTASTQPAEVDTPPQQPPAPPPKKSQAPKEKPAPAAQKLPLADQVLHPVGNLEGMVSLEPLSDSPSQSKGFGRAKDSGNGNGNGASPSSQLQAGVVANGSTSESLAGTSGRVTGAGTDSQLQQPVLSERQIETAIFDNPDERTYQVGKYVMQCERVGAKVNKTDPESMGIGPTLTFNQIMLMFVEGWGLIINWQSIYNLLFLAQPTPTGDNFWLRSQEQWFDITLVIAFGLSMWGRFKLKEEFPRNPFGIPLYMEYAIWVTFALTLAGCTNFYIQHGSFNIWSIIV